MDEEKKKTVKSNGVKKNVKKSTSNTGKKSANKSNGKKYNKPKKNSNKNVSKVKTSAKKPTENVTKVLASQPEVVETEVRDELKVEEVLEEKVEKVVENEEPVINEIQVDDKKDSLLDGNVSIVAAVVMAFLLLMLFVSMYSDSLFNKYSSGWDGKSFLVEKSHVHQIKCDEIPNAITGAESFIYVTDAKGEDEFNLEKKLAKLINERNIKNNFYVYVLNDNCGPINVGNSVASVNLQLEHGLDRVPTILYYRNGVYMDKATRSDKQMINDGDFAQLLDMYEIK